MYTRQVSTEWKETERTGTTANLRERSEWTRELTAARLTESKHVDDERSKCNNDTMRKNGILHATIATMFPAVQARFSLSDMFPIGQVSVFGRADARHIVRDISFVGFRARRGAPAPNLEAHGPGFPQLGLRDTGRFRCRALRHPKLAPSRVPSASDRCWWSFSRPSCPVVLNTVCVTARSSVFGHAHARHGFRDNSCV